MGCMQSAQTGHVIEVDRAEIPYGAHWQHPRKDRATSPQKPHADCDDITPALVPVGPGAQPLFHKHCVILNKLGRGAFASVYAMRVVGSDREWAVKVLDTRSKKVAAGEAGPEIDPGLCRAAARELSALRRVKSPGVVQMVANIPEDGVLYLVMEKCDKTLEKFLTGMPSLTEDTLKPVLRQMLLGISATHAARLVHRDVKPDNFMVAGETVKLVDFGLARSVSSAYSSELRGVSGSPPYMAPEMLYDSYYGGKVDTWAFGASAYCIFFGRFPYMPHQLAGSAIKKAIVENSRPPTFRRPGARAAASPEHEASPAAVSLLKQLLIRNAAARPTATEALASPFFAQTSGNGGQQQASLHPMLLAAQSCGAFTQGSGKARSVTDVDVYLGLKQARYHQSPWDAKAASLCHSSAPTQAGSAYSESVSSGFSPVSKFSVTPP